MRRQAVMFLILALAAGGIAAFLATRMLRTPPQVVEAAEASGSVAVAARDMNVGTLLESNDVRLVDWPADAIPVGYSSSVADLVGRGLLVPVKANEPLLSSKLANPEAGGGMQIIIPEGKRAMAVRVDDVVGVAGFVLPGTRVDVLVTMDRAAGQEEAATRMVLQDLEVISAGQSLERNPDGEPQQVPVVTLLVTPEEAEELALAHSNGRLQLALRNPLDMDTVSTPGIRASRLIAGRPAPRPVVRSSAPAPAPVSRPESVELEIYRGPERTTATVDTTIGGGGE
jgi:pilus assembly protein CpaB